MKRTIFFLFLILIMQVVLRTPFLLEPLEGDEGVYAYMGQRILMGEVPYRDYFDHKPPAVYYIYSVILKFFGETIFSIRFATALLSLITTLFVFLIGRKLFSEIIGLLSAFLYALFSGGPYIEGAGSNTEVFMILFLLIAFYFFIADRNRSRALFLCGLFSGLAFMTKQVALFNFLVFLFWNPKKEPRVLLAGSFLIVPLIFAFYFWLNHGLSDFINSAFLFNLGYIQPWPDIFSLYRTGFIAIKENSILWLLGLAGALFIIIRERKWETWLVVFWFIASALGTFLGGFCFGHYYIQLIPALCLLSGFMIFKWQEIKPPLWINISGISIILFLFALALVFQYPFYLQYTPEEISLYKYEIPNNVLAYRAARSIMKEDNIEGKFIAVRFFPQIYFYTKRIYPGKYFYGVARHGMICDIIFNNQNICHKELKVRTKEKFLSEDQSDLERAVANKNTKYAIFNADNKDFPPLFRDMIKKQYIYRADLGEWTCRVFKRAK